MLACVRLRTCARIKSSKLVSQHACLLTVQPPALLAFKVGLILTHVRVLCTLTRVCNVKVYTRHKNRMVEVPSVESQNFLMGDMLWLRGSVW